MADTGTHSADAAHSMPLGPRDPELFAENMAEVTRLSSRLASAMMPADPATQSTSLASTQGEVMKTFGEVWQSVLSNPDQMLQAQTSLWRSYFELWDFSARKLAGEEPAPVAKVDPRDKRFKDEAWGENAYFDLVRQGYLVLDGWTRDIVEKAEGLDDHTRHKAGFYLNQMLAAAAPSNYLATNPELLKQTLEENGENLVRGLKALARDFEEGEGQLKLRQSDTSPFKLGENIATTPGAVIYRNDLFELIQFEATTDEVLKRPLLIVPPWINKYYVLDLNEEKSLVRWLVAEGHTVFVVSWVNPDARHAKLSFDDYAKDGILEAVRVVGDVTGGEPINAVGYCIGGTLLAATLAHMAADEDDRIASCTFLTTQVDFTHAGDLKVFADEDQIAAVEQQMAQKGYLEGSQMASAFNMLRPDDLIWPYVVNNYIRGKDPFPFDLLYWNSDSTRMPAANHAFYLRHCYLRNDLSNGRMIIDGRAVDLGNVKIPIYNLATREDHIAPPLSVYTGSNAFGGPVDYVMAGSGHIAGVVNPPSRNKYQFWEGARDEKSFEDWVASAQETAGSWWPHWHAWLEAQDDERVAARSIGGGRFNAIEAAPGSYVRVKA